MADDSNGDYTHPIYISEINVIFVLNEHTQ